MKFNKKTIIPPPAPGRIPIRSRDELYKFNWDFIDSLLQFNFPCFFRLFLITHPFLATWDFLPDMTKIYQQNFNDLTILSSCLFPEINLISVPDFTKTSVTHKSVQKTFFDSIFCVLYPEKQWPCSKLYNFFEVSLNCWSSSKEW